MVYSYFADYSKKVLHYGIELAFPRTATIATISAAVGWYAYRYAQTELPGYLRDMSVDTCTKNTFFGSYAEQILCKFAPPFFVPDFVPPSAEAFSFIASAVTSLTLNIATKTVSLISRKAFHLSKISYKKLVVRKTFIPSIKFSPPLVQHIKLRSRTEAVVAAPDEETPQEKAQQADACLSASEDRNDPIRKASCWCGHEEKINNIYRVFRRRIHPSSFKKIWGDGKPDSVANTKHIGRQSFI